MRTRLALVPTVGLVLLAVRCIYSLVENSADPMRDYRGYHDPEHYVFPATEVLHWSIAIGIEALAAIAVLAFTRSLATMCFCLAVLCGIAVMGFGMLAMHAPAYYTGHVFWLFCAGVWLLVCSIILGVIRASSNRRGSA